MCICFSPVTEVLIYVTVSLRLSFLNRIMLDGVFLVLIKANANQEKEKDKREEKKG